MKEHPPTETHAPAGNSQFYSSLLASLGEMNKLLPRSEYPKLHQEITDNLSSAAENANSAEFLITAIRLELYALLALSR
ncbi:MAG: hypothetical protein H6Q64_97 [Firmicutes bacterium]|nr:hypothetical protein [Bacillota bacterium]